MKREELQKAIDQAVYLSQDDSDLMLQIGKSYLHGEVIKDPVAAKAWLERILEQGESPQAVKAMELLGREVLKKDRILSEEDYEAICKDVKNLRENKAASNNKKAYLLALKALGDAERSSHI